VTTETDPETSLRAGLADGIREALPYLLSHHHPDEYHKCYRLSLGSRQLRLCARCSGIYPGIVAGLAVALLVPAAWWILPAIVVLPAPAIGHWVWTHTTERVGYNGVRTLTGLLVGLAYGLGVVRFVATFPNPALFALALGYGGLTGVLAWRYVLD
jgi:uncharacterized membrane protein